MTSPPLAAPEQRTLPTLPPPPKDADIVAALSSAAKRILQSGNATIHNAMTSLPQSQGKRNEDLQRQKSGKALHRPLQHHPRTLSIIHALLRRI